MRAKAFYARLPKYPSQMAPVTTIVAAAIIITTTMTAALLADSGAQAAAADIYLEVGVSVEVVADGLDIPWDVQFAPDGTAFLTTRPGVLYIIQDGTISEALRLRVGGGEGGMLGVALHPNYTENHLVYVYHTEPGSGNKVVRYIHLESGLVEESVIIDGIPAASNHNGGRIRVGPDSMLYVTTGDAGSASRSQDIASLAGKILRLTPEGTVPADNPWEGSPVYAYGLRNPQGISWNGTGSMIATDHGPSGFYGRGHDEINVIIPGGNYGWPDAIGSRTIPGIIPPLIHSGGDTWAPSGATHLAGSAIPQWDGMILYGALRGEHLGLVSQDGTAHAKLFQGEFGRIRAPVQHPDGSVYLMTSNTDGRGSAAPRDDVLLRITAHPPIPDGLREAATLLWEWHYDGDITRAQLDMALAYLSGSDGGGGN